MAKEGKDTTEHKQSSLVMAMSVILPIVALACDLLVGEDILAGGLAVVAGLLSSAIASAGYSYSRGRAKAEESRVAAIRASRAIVSDAAKKKVSGA
jgi:hypothetical protein